MLKSKHKARRFYFVGPNGPITTTLNWGEASNRKALTWYRQTLFNQQQTQEYEDLAAWPGFFPVYLEDISSLRGMNSC